MKKWSLVRKCSQVVTIPCKIKAQPFGVGVSSCQEPESERSASEPMPGSSGARFSVKEIFRFLLFGYQNAPSRDALEEVVREADEDAILAICTSDVEGWDDAASLASDHAEDSSSDRSEDEADGDAWLGAREEDREGDGGGMSNGDAGDGVGAAGVVTGAPAAVGAAPMAGAGGPAIAAASRKAAVVDPYEGWYLAQHDSSVGRIPLTASMGTRFLVQHVPAHLPRVPQPGSPLAFFRLYWDAKVVSMILLHTNSRLRRRGTDELTERELWVWLALTLVMGVCKQPTIESYWSTMHYGRYAFLRQGLRIVRKHSPPSPLSVTCAATTNFAYKRVMTRERFVAIKVCLAVSEDRVVTPAQKAAPSFDR